jgi:hypothetical protein
VARFERKFGFLGAEVVEPRLKPGEPSFAAFR